MPNIKSAKKRVKVIQTKTLQNKMFKNQMRTIVHKNNAAHKKSEFTLALNKLA